jgi:hypothetical protein
MPLSEEQLTIAMKPAEALGVRVARLPAKWDITPHKSILLARASHHGVLANARLPGIEATNRNTILQDRARLDTNQKLLKPYFEERKKLLLSVLEGM